MAQISDVGFKISKPGYDANQAAGSNLVFDSNWPSLPIAFETDIDNPITSSVSTATVVHNLNFPAFTWVWAYYDDPSGINNVCRRFIAASDANNVYLSGNTPNRPPFNASRLKIRCFRLDLSKDVDYLLADRSTFNLPYDNSFGIKFVKQGKDINSKDLRDFAIYSRAESPLILAVKTELTISNNNLGTTIGNVIQYKSSLSYPVWVYGFTKSTSEVYTPAAYYSQSYPRTFTDGFLSYVGYISPDIGATLVILRDPMFAPSQTTVQY